MPADPSISAQASPAPLLALHMLLSCPGSCPGPRAACRRLRESSSPAQHKQFCFQRQLWASIEKGKAALARDKDQGQAVFPALGPGPSQPVGILGKGPGDRPSPQLLQSIWLRLGAEK